MGCTRRKSTANAKAASMRKLASETLSKVVNHDDSIAPMEISMREAAIMLDRDLPRAIHIIKNNSSAYPNGYLSNCGALLDFIQSPQIVSMLQSLVGSNIETMPLKEKLPQLAVTRTANILSAMIVALDKAGIASFQNAPANQAPKGPETVLIETQNALHRLIVASTPQPSLFEMSLAIPSQAESLTA